MRSAAVLLGTALCAGCARAPVTTSPTPTPAPAQVARAAERARDAAGSSYRRGIDVLDYDLTLDLPERGAEIRGRAVLTVRRQAPANALTLDLLRLTVDSVLVNGAPRPFVRTPETVGVPLPDESEAKVTIVYHGEVTDGLIVRTDSAGRWTGFGDNWPDRARNWIPSVDHPSDKATVTWRVRAPSERTVVANGALVERVPAGDGRTLTVWRERQPIPVYLMVIAAAPLVRYDLGETACGLAELARCVPQSVYTAPEQQRIVPGDFEEAGEIVRWFSQMVGPFPYEKLAHLQSSTRFGGMENASAIFYADALFRRTGVGEGLIAHETAHQWFGDAVTERDWPHLWLSEGFATYFAALFSEHAHGDSAFRAARIAIRDAVLTDRQAVPVRPVIDTLETNLLALLNRNSYEKGGFVLHMLRRQVGDSAFFRALREYYAAHRHGNALTSDLQAAMEHASGQSLGWFLDQWLRRPGYPELRAAWTRTADGVLELTVEQGARFGAYRFPLTIAVTRADGTTGRARLEIPAEPRTVVRLPGRYAAEPSRVELDPDADLLATFVTVHR
jgi:aminopeptidase N